MHSNQHPVSAHFKYTPGNILVLVACKHNFAQWFLAGSISPECICQVTAAALHIY